MIALFLAATWLWSTRPGTQLLCCALLILTTLWILVLIFWGLAPELYYGDEGWLFVSLMCIGTEIVCHAAAGLFTARYLLLNPVFRK